LRICWAAIRCRRAPTGYQPSAQIADLLWNEDDLAAGETAALMASPDPVSLSRAG